MIRKEVDVHLEALAGLINDDDKLVTYKWLSKELSIHVNLAKQLLFEYWESRRKEKGAVIATFLLMGHLDDGGMRVEVVKEADLPVARKRLTKIVAEHIYSLQQTLPDIELLAITDGGDSQHSAVHCEESVIRSEHEMEILRWGSSLPSNKSVNILPSSLSKIQEHANAETKAAKESIAKITAINKPVEKTQKNAFNNLFAKAIGKHNKEKVSSDNTRSKGTVSKNSPPKNAWFEAVKKPKSANERPATSKESITDEIPSEEAKISASVISDSIKNKTATASDDSDDSLPKKNARLEANKTIKSGKEEPESNGGFIKAAVENEWKEPSPENNRSGRSETSEKNIDSHKTMGKEKLSSRGKKRQSSAKRESVGKRRKRIVVADSSDESNDSEMEGVEEPDAVEERPASEKIRSSPSPPLVKCEGGRRKVRKLVDRTFMDEDGYFVTQKEYIYESSSDKEEEVQLDINKPSPPEPAIKNINNRKQATLLNFFKKA